MSFILSLWWLHFQNYIKKWTVCTFWDSVHWMSIHVNPLSSAVTTVTPARATLGWTDIKLLVKSSLYERNYYNYYYSACIVFAFVCNRSGCVQLRVPCSPQRIVIVLNKVCITHVSVLVAALPFALTGWSLWNQVYVLSLKNLSSNFKLIELEVNRIKWANKAYQ